MINIYRAPELSLRWIPVWRRNLLVWRKLAIASILGNIADPLLYMVAIGYGIGSFIPEMNGMKYIAFIGTGMVCQSAMFTASFEGMYSAFSRMFMQRTWDAIMNTPISLDDVLLAEWIWTATKSVFSVTAILLVNIPEVGFLGAWFFLTLAPTSSVVPIVTEVGAERRMYLPLAGLAVLAVVGLYRWIGDKAAPWVVAALVGALAFGTVQRNREYASSVSLLQTSVERWPQGRAHFNLAIALKAQGQRDEAMAHLRSAVVDDPEAQYVLGSELYDRGQFDAAISELRAFMDRRPVSRADVISAHNLLALALAQQGKLAGATEEFQRALRMDPKNPDLHGNLAFTLLQQRDFEGARQHYEEYLSARPGNPFVLTNLGAALEGLGQRQSAIKRYQQALALDPSYQPALNRLAAVEQPIAR